MSHEFTNLCRPIPMTPPKKSVLLCLADRADNQGTSFPSIPKICDHTSFKRTAVIDALKWLAAQGLVSVDQRRVHNVYTLNRQALIAASQSASRTMRGEKAARGADASGPSPEPLAVRETDENSPADGPKANILHFNASNINSDEGEAVPGDPTLWERLRLERPTSAENWNHIRALVKAKSDMRSDLANILLRFFLRDLSRDAMHKQWERAVKQE